MPIWRTVVLSGFQRYFCMQYTTIEYNFGDGVWLFYQDFNEQFEGYTQLLCIARKSLQRCFIRISMNNLKDIHNAQVESNFREMVVLSGFQ